VVSSLPVRLTPIGSLPMGVDEDNASTGSNSISPQNRIIDKDKEEKSVSRANNTVLVYISKS
jgi:hypothetical protein